MRSEKLHRALEDWLAGLVRSGAHEGCTGAVLVVFYGERAEFVSATEDADLKAVGEKLRTVADGIADGDGYPLGRNGQTLSGEVK